LNEPRKLTLARLDFSPPSLRHFLTQSLLPCVVVLVLVLACVASLVLVCGS